LTNGGESPPPDTIALALDPDGLVVDYILLRSRGLGRCAGVQIWS